MTCDLYAYLQDGLSRLKVGHIELAKPVGSRCSHTVCKTTPLIVSVTATTGSLGTCKNVYVVKINVMFCSVLCLTACVRVRVCVPACVYMRACKRACKNCLKTKHCYFACTQCLFGLPGILRHSS